MSKQCSFFLPCSGAYDKRIYCEVTAGLDGLHYGPHTGSYIYDYGYGNQHTAWIQDNPCGEMAVDCSTSGYRYVCTFDRHAGPHSWEVTAPQPPPKVSELRPRVLDLVIHDLATKAEAGKEKYGVYLQPFNGRSSLRDAYQEAVDLVMYLRQKLYEEEGQ